MSRQRIKLNIHEIDISHAPRPIDLANLPRYEQNDQYGNTGEPALLVHIRKHGLFNPITVTQSEGKYYLLTGGHRLACFWELAKTDQDKYGQIDCYLHELSGGQTISDLKFSQLIQSYPREELHWTDKAKTISHVLDNSEATLDELANMLAMSPASISQHHKVYQLLSKHQEFAELCKQHKEKITFTHARIIAIKCPESVWPIGIQGLAIFPECTVRNFDTFIESVKDFFVRSNHEQR